MKNTASRLALAVVALLLVPVAGLHAVPFHVTYLWHMHQPIYYPYESPQQIDSNGRFNFSVQGVWDGDRIGAYTSWPKDAVQAGADKGMDHAGAQMSYSGSLGENNNNLWGYATGASWDDALDWARNGLKTSLNNPRLDIVGIAYHHSLMPLTCKESMIMQIRLHKEQYKELWDTGGAYSKGFWPPECAFDNTMIPALVEEGLEWVIVDNGHLFRAVPDFPWSSASSCRPNPAEVRNPTSTQLGSQWVQLQNVWAPTKVLAPWSYQPHYVRYVNPTSGAIQKIVAVPAGRYEGNENGRGGYGAFKPENVWGPHVSVNTDSSKPMMILCHSDGDNYGMKNSDAWHGQHNSFLEMCKANGDFEHTSIQDYLQLYPPDADDVIHVEPGSWIGIDGGTPYYEKWLSYENRDGEMPDMWSWSVLVAAQNRVILADALENSYLNLGGGRTIDDVEWGLNNDTARAWHYYLVAETSCYWYWDYDRANPWDGNVTRAANLAIAEASKVIARHAGTDSKGPSIFPPQRLPYNPGGYMWNESAPASSDFEVWTFVDDHSGVNEVRLHYRRDKDGFITMDSIQNETFAGGDEVEAWQSVAMTNSWWPNVKGPDGIVPSPANRAMRYTGRITGESNVLLDYFVEAVDNKGNTNRSNILHVYVGQRNTTNTVPVTFAPAVPEDCDDLVVTYNSADRNLGGANPVTLMLYYDNDAQTNEYAMSGTVGGLWRYTSSIPSGARSAKVMFRNGGTYDNNSGQGWSKSIIACYVAPAIAFDPPAPDGCSPVMISYQPNSGALSNANPVRIHIGYNDWQNVVTPDPAMTNNAGTWEYWYYPPAGTYEINICLNDGGAVWDNNNGEDYGVAVSNCVSTNEAVVLSPAFPRDCETLTITYDPSGRPLQGEDPIFVTLTFDDWATYGHHPMSALNGKWVYSIAIPGESPNVTMNFRSESNDAPAVLDNNAGANWSAAVSSCETGTFNGIRFAYGSPAISAGGSPNNVGDSFDMVTTGGGATTRGTGGFGSFGRIYVNYDETNLYVGGEGCDVVASNNAMIVFLSLDSLSDNAENFWNMSDQDPYGLDKLHNAAFFQPVDIAILLGDVWGDGTFTNFNLGNGSPFGQGVFYLNAGSGNFWPMGDALLSQFDGVGTTACTSTWDSSSRQMTRWECAIPWASVNAPAGIDSITNCTLSGVIVSDTVSGDDRYLSAKYLGLPTSSGTLDEYGSVGLNFLVLNGLPVEKPESYLHGVPMSWINEVFGSGYDFTETSDFDDDGMTDRDEYLAGTNAKDYLSSFELGDLMSARAAGDKMVVRWSSVRARTYDLFSAPAVTGTYELVQGAIPATPPENAYTDTVSAVELRFYRVRTGP